MITRDQWPTMPPGIAKLPTQEGTGYPVPWFVEWIDGKPDFRVMNTERYVEAVREKRCWICGGLIVSLVSGPAPQATFVIGPMCAINRTSAEPPSHMACAEWSAHVCPFLVTPGRSRRYAGLPDERQPSGGIMIERNPGIALLWTSVTWRPYKPVTGGVLFHIGEPYRSPVWLREGRPATRDEVLDAISTGMPQLVEVATAHDELAFLERAVAATTPLLPRENPS